MHNKEMKISILLFFSTTLIFLTILKIVTTRFEDPVKTITYSWKYCDYGGVRYSLDEMISFYGPLEFRERLKSIMLNLCESELLQILCENQYIRDDVELIELRKNIIDFYLNLENEFSWTSYFSNKKANARTLKNFINHKRW